EESALEQAGAKCSADAEQRSVRRERAEIYRNKQDQVLAMRMAESIRQMFPGCPPEEAQAIAAHTSVRGSGRVGRTASGRALDEEALRAAVVASIRHRRTKYDRLLMKGLGRMDARDTVRHDIDRVLESWRRAPGYRRHCPPELGHRPSSGAMYVKCLAQCFIRRRSRWLVSSAEKDSGTKSSSHAQTSS